MTTVAAIARPAPLRGTLGGLATAGFSEGLGFLASLGSATGNSTADCGGVFICSGAGALGGITSMTGAVGGFAAADATGVGDGCFTGSIIISIVSWELVAGTLLAYETFCEQSTEHVF